MRQVAKVRIVIRVDRFSAVEIMIVLFSLLRNQIRFLEELVTGYSSYQFCCARTIFVRVMFTDSSLASTETGNITHFRFCCGIKHISSQKKDAIVD